MRTLQDVGIEILTDNPAKFYIFVGTEYGIKCKYLEHLQKYYHGNVQEDDSIESVLKSFQTKSLMPTLPSLYIVRYDSEFVSSLTNTSVRNINPKRINGTLVCIYEDEKQSEKLDKYLPDYVVSIDKVDKKFIIKYLREDFPNLSDRLINIAASIGNDYNHAKNIAYSMSVIPDTRFDIYSDKAIAKMFGVNSFTDENNIRIYTASKNFRGMLNIISSRTKDYDDIVYNMISTLLEIDKLKNQKYSDSPIHEYTKSWTKSDIYYMYNHCYDTIHKIRLTPTNDYDLMVELITFLNFERIPSSI